MWVAHGSYLLYRTTLAVNHKLLVRIVRLPTQQIASSSSGSSQRWQDRQQRDHLKTHAKSLGFNSRAAFKLVEIDDRYGVLRPGQLVLDLGYAPGSWSQVALKRTRPRGRVIGIDINPSRPPQGVVAFQGDFLSQIVQNEVKRFLRNCTQKTSLDSVGVHGTKTIPEKDHEGLQVLQSLETVSYEGPRGHDDLAEEAADVILSDMFAFSTY